MKAKIQVEYKKNRAMPFLTQGIKHGRRPNNGYKTVGGSNGSFVQVPKWGRADIVVMADVPGGMFPISIGTKVRSHLGIQRLTDSVAKKVIGTAPRSVEVVSDAHGTWTITDAALKDWLTSIA